MEVTAMQHADDQGNVVTWGEHVTDDQYAAAPRAIARPRSASHQGRTAMQNATTCGYQRHAESRIAARKPA